MKLHYNHNLNRLSRGLRSNSTLSEVLLWKEIKNKKLGAQFLRQRPIGNYIVDFYCPVLKLAIEIDGVSHDAKIESDVNREKRLNDAGIKVLHFQDIDVKNNLDGVLLTIKSSGAKVGATSFSKGGLNSPFSKWSTRRGEGFKSPFGKGSTPQSGGRDFRNPPAPKSAPPPFIKGESEYPFPKWSTRRGRDLNYS